MSSSEGHTTLLLITIDISTYDSLVASFEGDSMEQIDESNLVRDKPAEDSGFIRFYGLFWSREHVDWDSDRLLGLPKGWMGSGKTSVDFDQSSVQVNFWKQKGVYILYDSSLNAVYAGQAGLLRKADSEGRYLGARLHEHSKGVYRNGWSLFSWFGFMATPKLKLRTASSSQLNDPSWAFSSRNDSSLNLLLASFEAILIEGFSPRFNARGGDLGKAVFVNQYEPLAKIGSIGAT